MPLEESMYERFVEQVTLLVTFPHQIQITYPPPPPIRQYDITAPACPESQIYVFNT